MMLKGQLGGSGAATFIELQKCENSGQKGAIEVVGGDLKGMG
jgi:hypothetical protein